MGAHVAVGRLNGLDGQRTRPSEATHALRSQRSLRAPARMLWVEMMVSLTAMLLVSGVVGATWATALVVSAASLSVRYWSGAQVHRPGLPRAVHVLRDTTVPFCLAALMVAVGWWGRDDLLVAIAISVTGGGVALAGAALRHSFLTAQRVVVVGSAVGVAEATTRFSGSRHINLVGSLVVEGEFPHVPRPRTGSSFNEMVADVREIDQDVLLRSDPDMVMVVPTSGIDAEQVRRIGWALEGTGTALAVHNGLEGISPHRLESTTYAGVPLTHVSSSRPARLPLVAKQVFDRVAGVLILTAVSPLLLVLIALVRFTSDGPGIFRQVRVGQHGKHFTMYKFRTMITTAETDKAALMDENEGAGVLFKMTDDPRITKVGRVLRKFSLDELPQLINVVRGEMSLVGPRPALPEEVAQYSSLERRRLAAKPGITGLWQVSGRSDLSWDESVRLDNHYTENWRLADDGLILVRTVQAVAFSNGAY